MAKLRVKEIQHATLKSSGYLPQPEGEIILRQNKKTYDVKAYAYADVQVPIEDPVSVTPSTIPITVEPHPGYEGLSQVKVAAAPLEEATVTPDTVQRTYSPQAPAIGFSEVIVEAIKQGLPIDPESLMPLFFGIDDNGFYYSDDSDDETPVFFGLDVKGIYVTGGDLNG